MSKEVHEKGKAEGKIEEKVAIARNMKNDGVDLNVIAKYTSLSPKEIERFD